MNLLDRFSTHLKDILSRAIALATELRNPEVEPIHLFFALTNQKGSVAAEIIGRFKIDPKITDQLIINLPILKKTETTPRPVAEKTITPLSDSSRMALEKALYIAQENHHNYLGSEHLLAALVEMNDQIINELLKINNLKTADLEKQIHTVLNNATMFPQIGEIAETVERLNDQMENGVIPSLPSLKPKSKKGNGKNKESALEFFALNLTDPTTQKNIDPVIGRETEIERLIQILARRTKNNPILLGDPGVGKTAIVEGLGKKIINGEVPDILLNKKIYSLDMGLLIAGTIYRGEFEARLKEVIDDVADNPNIILFIDEIHNIVGAGSNQGAMDAANILKPALARGTLRCIGSTTPGEFKKHIENDPALERRFQPVMVKEPSPEEAIQILSGIKKNYENYHRVTITDSAVRAAVELSGRYINGKFLPDKAIDLLDETAAAKRLTAKITPWENKLQRLEKNLEQTILAKETAAGQDKFDEAFKLKSEENFLRQSIKKIQDEAKNKTIKMVGTIDEKDIARQIAKITGTPPAQIMATERDRFSDLENTLNQQIIGQETAIGAVAKTIRQAQLGISSHERPLASFLFVGVSGVGKTELAKNIAETLYPRQNALIKLDMSEFNEQHSTAKLLGAPAGYIGFKESNQFSDKIKLNPYCVVLFDEIDKAHPDVTKLLLQMLENGTITDSSGKQISLKHAIIILTTTTGATDAAKGAIGFGSNKESDRQVLVDKLKEKFSGELIDRLDAICYFNKLSTANLEKIAALEIDKLNQRLTAYHTTIKPSAAALTTIVAALSATEGARALRRQIQTQVENLIAELILKSKIKKVYQLTAENKKLIIK